MNQPVVEVAIEKDSAGFAPGGDLTLDVWNALHGRVQEELARLEEAVRQRVPEVRADQGRTCGERFYLFSYRTFSVPGNGIDPVVSGVTFAPTLQGVRVEADVSGEQTGDPITSATGKTVTHSQAALLAAVDELLRPIGQSADGIAAALNDAARKVL